MHKKGCFIGSIIVITAIIAILIIENQYTDTSSDVTGRPQLISLKLFDDPQCIISCWEGLRPNETKKDEIDKFFFENSSDISQVQVQTLRGRILYIGKYYNEAFVSAVVLDGKLFEVELSGTFDLTIEDIVKRLGFPEYINPISYTVNPDDSFSSYLWLFYPTKGYLFQHPIEDISQEGDSVRICIEKEGLVNKVTILAPTSIDQFLVDFETSNGRTLSEIQISQQRALLTSWPGFKCIYLPKN